MLASQFGPIGLNMVYAAAPTVALTYSTNPAKAGIVTVTATYSEEVDATPDISIDQPGSTDISAVAMTDAGTGTIFTYDYTVVAADASSYIDGTATVSLSSVNSVSTSDPA